MVYHDQCNLLRLFLLLIDNPPFNNSVLSELLTKLQYLGLQISKFTVVLSYLSMLHP